MSKIDIAEELYKDAQNNLAIVSQPQYSFKTTIDNLFALEEFVPLHKDMDIGNFVRLIPDMFSDDFIKLRLISIETNPLINTPDISIEFSTMTKSLSDMTDLTFLFDEKTSGGSSESSSSSSGGTYGKNDAEIKIANNMLNALLKTETFGTQVSDVILDSIRANSGNFKKLISHSGIFDTLESGEVKVNGACLTDIIKSLNYIANREGSMINLKDGSVDFAGGSLTYDKDKGLIIKGAKGKTSIDGSSVNTGSITSNNYNGTVSKPLGNTEGSIIDLTDGQFNFGGGKLKFEEDTLSVKGDITANNLIANKSGTIAGWYFDQTGFYKVDENGKKQMVLGDDGISAGDSLLIQNNGSCFINNVKSIKCGNSLEVDENKAIIKTKEAYDVYPSSVNMNVTSGVQTDLSITLDNICVGDTFDLTIQNIRHYFDNDGLRKYGNVIINIDGIVPNNVETGDNTDDIYNTSLSYSPECTITALPMIPYTWVYHPNNSTLTINFTYDFLSSLKHPSYSDESKYTCSGNMLGYISSNENYNHIKSIIINGIDHNIVDYRGFGINIDTLNKRISGDLFTLQPDKLSLYNNFVLRCYDSKDGGTISFSIDKDHLIHKNLSTTSSGTNLASLDGSFVLKSSSSQRYKHDIKSIDDKLKSLNPHKLYDIDVVTFKYNDDYLQPSDQRYNTDIPGFIAEDIYEKYPIACNLNSQGRPEMWEINIMFPAALKLIQEQHEEIENLKKRIEILEQRI